MTKTNFEIDYQLAKAMGHKINMYLTEKNQFGIVYIDIGQNDIGIFRPTKDMRASWSVGKRFGLQSVNKLANGSWNDVYVNNKQGTAKPAERAICLGAIKVIDGG